MTTHVPQRPGAKSPKPSPTKRDILLMVLFPGRRSKPQVPIQFLWRGLGALRSAEPLRPHGTIGPDMNGRRVSYQAGIVPFLHQSYPIAGRPLVTHLRDHFISFGSLGEHT